MPEGHTIHRAARRQTRRFGGQDLRVWSPQGRFAIEARVLDGRTMMRVDARGKHLLYRWEGAVTLHVHLGLFGKFKIGHGVEPSANARVAWRSATDTLALSGPTVCELIDDDDEADLLRRIGPDPLDPRGDDLERICAALSRRSIPIGAALLDQSVLAGVGNVYRAEILFLGATDPRTPSRDLGAERVERLWSIATAVLDDGRRLGRIVTVDPAEVGVKRLKDVPEGSRLYAYKRTGAPCRRCATPIASMEMGGRNIWWCPVCQSR